jgi:hypothetical protein
VRFIVLAIFLTGDLLRECALSSRNSVFDQDRRLRRPARLVGIAGLVWLPALSEAGRYGGRGCGFKPARRRRRGCGVNPEYPEA